MEINKDSVFGIQEQRSFHTVHKPATILVVGNGEIVHIGDEREYLEGKIGFDVGISEAVVDILAE